jgi:hypothetical protein
MQKKWELNFKKILANTEEIRYNMEVKLNIKKELKEIEEFLKSNKVGNIVIERKPNGTITIQKTETSQYKKEYANSKAT